MHIKHNFKPVYLETNQKGKLKEKIEAASAMLKDCTMCPLHCRAKRDQDQVGLCELKANPDMSQYFVGRGEEKILVGRHGSGLIFLNGFIIPCDYCINYEASLKGTRKEISHQELADAMLTLQSRGCYNINLVNPSNQVPQILKALEIAIAKGLEIPLVYNTSGYDDVDTLRLLEGVVDIYLSEFRFWKPEVYQKFCHLANYQPVVRAAVMEMQRQVGDLKINKDGIAERGLIIRHLVLPNGLAHTAYIMHFLANEVSKDTYVNISSEYAPTGKADHFPELNRRISFDEFREAVKSAVDQGLKRVLQQSK